MIHDFDLDPPEERGPMCSGCDRRGPEEDLDRNGLCAECREMTHYSLDGEERGPPRRDCDCPNCGAKYRPRPWNECITTPSIRDMARIARVRRDK